MHHRYRVIRIPRAVLDICICCKVGLIYTFNILKLSLFSELVWSSLTFRSADLDLVGYIDENVYIIPFNWKRIQHFQTILQCWFTFNLCFVETSNFPKCWARIQHVQISSINIYSAILHFTSLFHYGTHISRSVIDDAIFRPLKMFTIFNGRIVVQTNTIEEKKWCTYTFHFTSFWDHVFLDFWL